MGMSTATRNVRRWPAILAVLTLGGLMAPAGPLQADPTSPVVICDSVGVGVMTPGVLAGGDNGGTRGKLGGALIGGVFVGSKFVCSGALDGVAERTGSFASCAQIDGDGNRHPDSTPWTDPIPAPALAKGGAAEDTGFNCGGEYAWDSDHAVFSEELADTFVFNVHSASRGILEGIGWVWDDGSPGPPDCDLISSGHAPFPVEVQILVSCPRGDPDYVITFERPTVNSSVLLLGAAADLFHLPPSDENGNLQPDIQHCEVNDTSHDHVKADGTVMTGENQTTWAQDNPNVPLPERARCLRATLFNGIFVGTVEPVT